MDDYSLHLGNSWKYLCQVRNIRALGAFAATFYSDFMSSYRYYVALILARGGSKQIPNKNLAIIENKSILRRAIETAKAAAGKHLIFHFFNLNFLTNGIIIYLVFDEIWVSTDDIEIHKEAIRAGAEVFVRSEETSSDAASSLEAILEFSNYIQSEYKRSHFVTYIPNSSVNIVIFRQT